MDEIAKKNILRSFTYGLSAIAVASGEQRNVFTANWVSQVSFEPPMVMVSVENDGASIEMIRASGLFAIHPFTSGQRDLAGALGKKTKRGANKMEGLTWQQGPSGLPLLSETLGYLACRVTGTVEAGDHTVFVAEVVEAGQFHEGEPLAMRETGFRYFG